MDLSHPIQLENIARLLDDRFHIARSWTEAKCVSGETPDVLSVVERCFSWSEDPESYSVPTGSTVISEYKASIADLKKDAFKPWRNPLKRSLGDWRIYWLHKSGPVRPEHVDESTGWGVVMYDEHDAELVREPEPWHCVNTWAQTALIVKLMSREARRGTDATPSSRLGGKTKHAINKNADAAFKLIEKGPITYSQIKRELGIKGTALLKALERDGRVEQDGAGGVWKLKDEVTA